MKMLVIFLVITMLGVFAIEEIKGNGVLPRDKAQWPPAEPVMDAVHTLNGPLWYPRENSK